MLSASCVGCGTLEEGKAIKNKSVSTQMTFADTPTEPERRRLETQAAQLNQTLNEERKNANQASDVFESTASFLKSAQ